jgi:hypothetical protein
MAAALLAGAAVVVSGCASRSSSTSDPTVSPTGTGSTRPAANFQPLPGPRVRDARLFPGGTGYVRTGTHIWWTKNYGRTWHDATPPGLGTAELARTTVTFLADGHEWVVLTPLQPVPSVTVFTRAGQPGRWTQATVTASTIHAMAGESVSAQASFVDAKTGWLLISQLVTHESRGELLATDDGGQTWTVRASGAGVPYYGPMQFVSGSVGVIQSGLSGTDWRTDDGGRTWTKAALQPPAALEQDHLTVVTPSMPGRRNALLVAASLSTPVQGDMDGVALYRSADGGRSWDVHVLASEDRRESYSAGNLPGTDAVAVVRASADHGTSMATWTLSWTADGGATYRDTQARVGAFPIAVSAADPEHLWVTAESDGCRAGKAACFETTGLFTSRDGGLHWRQALLPS